MRDSRQINRGKPGDLTGYSFTLINETDGRMMRLLSLVLAFSPD